MATESEIRGLFAEFCGNVIKSDELMLAEVVEVDCVERTCTVLDDGVEYYGVRLQPVVEKDGGLGLFPKVGAFVLIAKIEGGDLYVVTASEYDSITLKIDDISLLLDKNGIVANNGDNGLVKINKLIEWMNKVYSDLNNLKATLATHPVAGNGSPLGLKIDFSTPKPIKSDFEDTRFKH